MKYSKIIRAFLLSLFVTLNLQVLAQDNPRTIFDRAVNQVMTDRIELSMDIAVTDQKGRIREKAYDVLVAKFGEVEYTRTVMQKPERARGITVVIKTIPDETGMIEVYTPANGKVRKMQATPENMERVGSNFSLSGYASYDPDDLDYTSAGMQELDGKNCHTLHISDRSDSEGMQAEFLVEESTFQIVRIRFFDKQGKNTNITSLSNYQSIPGIAGKIQPMQIEVQDLVENSRTNIQVRQLTHRPELKEVDFVLRGDTM